MTAITFLLNKRNHRQLESHSSTAGFTMIELIVVVVIVGILAAMAGAGYLGWMARMRVNKAQDVALQAIRQAQTTAKQRSSTWQASFQQQGDKVKWAVHSASSVPPDNLWNTIDEPNVKIDITAGYTSIYNDPTNNLWRVQFDSKGQVSDQVGRITLSNTNGGNKRCVKVRTILGAVKTDSDTACSSD
ncbi:pilus assembly FimT family protein [Kamptonema formosum]|uniref:pilus assembly FimT family protein n=1 Tax=Kamptonema formosum TaxID=331992 RepID=UPI000344E8AB|nr:type II secretion system protein [Oscillatoria sp. PCC 10802]